VLPRAADLIILTLEGAEVHFLRRDVTRLACTTVTFAKAEQILPTDPKLPVRVAHVSVIRGIATLARLGGACVDGALVSVKTVHRQVNTAAAIGAVVGGAQVTIIAIEFFADNAHPAITSAVVTFTLARVPVRKRHIVAGTRSIVAINRAAISVVLATRAQVLAACSVHANVVAAAG